MGVFLPRNSSMNRSACESSGSSPGACKTSRSLPKHRSRQRAGQSAEDQRTAVPCQMPESRSREYAWHFRLGICYLHSPCHPQMNHPLSMPQGTIFSPAGLFQIENDMLADATHIARFERVRQLGDVLSGGFKGLGLLAQPDGLDGVARDPLVQASGDSFHLRQFRHGNSVRHRRRPAFQSERCVDSARPVKSTVTQPVR